MRTNRLINGWPFVLPGLAFTLFVTLGPIAYVFVQSFQRVRLYRFNERPFIGLDNYLRVLGDMFVLRSVYVTILYTILVTLFCITLGLCISVLINKKYVKRKNLILAIYLLPFIVTHVVTGLIFRILILEPSYGLLNYVINSIFNANVTTAWTMNPATAFPVVIAVSVWRLIPLAILILYAGLTTIPNEVIEASTIDGASPFMAFRKIVYPLLHKHVFFVALVLMTSAFREYDTVFALTGGGPGRRTMVLSILIYLRGTQSHDYGMASAISVIMFLIIAVLAAVFMKTFTKVGRAEL